MFKRANTIIAILPVLLVLQGFAALSVLGQSYSVSPNSQLQIEGASSLNSFTCLAGEIKGSGTMMAASRGADMNAKGVTLTIPIKHLDCQNRRMNSDLNDALKGDAFPNIHFKLIAVEPIPSSDPQNATGPSSQARSHTVKALGSLSLAGVTKTVSVEVEGYTDSSGKIHGMGAVPFLMTDFGVTPPTALLGLVKARNEITIRFHLIADAVN
jgi:polyisoprenoid-binding protein YceI